MITRLIFFAPDRRSALIIALELVPRTNLVIYYGDDIYDQLGTLKPGQKIIVSPPGEVPLDSVTVITSEGIEITKPYRVPTKMPGMMGS